MTATEIKQIRIDAGFTQKELAEYLGLSGKQKIYQYEKGIRNPSKAVIKLLLLLKKN